MAANSILYRPHKTITSSQQGAKRNPHNSDQRQPLDIGRLDLRTHRNPSTLPTPDLRRGTDIRHSPRRNPTGDGTTSPSRIRLRSPSRVHLGTTASLSTKPNSTRATNVVTDSSNLSNNSGT